MRIRYQFLFKNNCKIRFLSSRVEFRCKENPPNLWKNEGVFGRPINFTVSPCCSRKVFRTEIAWQSGQSLQIRNLSTGNFKCMAGHSHWANIKFKKMHKDAEKSKKFGKLSLEIISAVREQGPDPTSNSKLDGIISRAKVLKMPKDSIESAIKAALRTGTETQVQALLEVRGPGRCGLLLDILSSNIKRTKPELITILKKNGAILSDEGSVSFMFHHKGVITVEGYSENNESKSKVEDIAILCGAEEFFFDTNEDGKTLLRFVCAPLDLRSVKDSLVSDHGVEVSSANEEQIAVKLLELDASQMTLADRLIDLLIAHPDVMRIFDNIEHYPSPTIKRDLKLA